MAWNVTSEWDDIHRKLGNYEPLPVEKSQKEHTTENIEKLEQLGERDLERELEEEDEDLDEEGDAFFEEYKRKKLEAMGGTKPPSDDNAPPKFGGVKEIDATDYIREVNNAGEGVPVILNFYQEYVESTLQINQALARLSPKYPEVKFLKTVATKCVPDFQDINLPYILHYRDGKLATQLTKPDLLSYRRLNEETIEHLLVELGIPKFVKKNKKNESVRGFIHEKLGRSKPKKEDFSSDEEEREDKQFVTNKAFIRY